VELEPTSSRNTGHGYLYAGACIFTSALVYYVVFRSQLPWPGHLLNLEWARLGQLTDYSKGSYPSFAFALSMGLIALGLFINQRLTAIKAILGIWVIGLLHEIFISTLTSTDVLAGSLGAAIALRITLFATGFSSYSGSSVSTLKQVATRNSVQHKSVFSDRIKLTVLMLLSIAFATGTSPYEEPLSSNCLEYDVNGICVNETIRATPVYMSYAELRSAVKVSENRALTSVSRILLYENYLFVNELNEGIHIIDNSFPSSPQRLGFIEIPGNQDVQIKDNALYADSYIDLVTIDVSNIENIREVARLEDVFPYNARQNIPENVRLSGTIDRTRGVVVGYQ